MPTLYDNFNQVRQFIDENNSSYVSKSELASASYVTTSQLPVIDESIVPKEDNTYTLGNSSYFYNTSYLTNLYLNSGTKIYADEYFLNIRVNGNTATKLSSVSFRPWTDNGLTLGASTNRWSTTYTSNLYTTNIIGDGITIKSDDDIEIYPYTGQIYTYSIWPSENNNYDLGDSNVKWRDIYTYNLHADNYYTETLVVNDNLIPTVDNYFTVGDNSYLYNAVYTQQLYINTNNKIYNTSNGGLRVQRGGTDICTFLGGVNLGISPISNNTGSLGNKDQIWKNLYVNNAYIGSSTYLPTNTYWYNGSSYVWLGSILT